MGYSYWLLPLYSSATQDGVTADEVAEVHGHQKVCEELRKYRHVGRRPLSQVGACQHNLFCLF